MAALGFFLLVTLLQRRLQYLANMSRGDKLNTALKRFTSMNLDEIPVIDPQ